MKEALLETDQIFFIFSYYIGRLLEFWGWWFIIIISNTQHLLPKKKLSLDIRNTVKFFNIGLLQIQF